MNRKKRKTAREPTWSQDTTEEETRDRDKQMKFGCSIFQTLAKVNDKDIAKA